MSNWGIALLGLGLFAWCFVAGFKVEAPLMRRLLRASRGSAWRAAGVTLLLHLVLVVVAVVLIVIGISVAEAADSNAAAGVVTVPGIGLLGPVVVCFLPARFSGVRLHRDELERTGATRAVARAITWVGAPLALLELSAAIGAFFATFLV